MRWFLLGIINTYRLLPDRYKQQCLFKLTCSTYVKRVTYQFGFLAGLKALKMRVSQCRPGYRLLFESESNQWQVQLAYGMVLDASCLADPILEPYHSVSHSMLENKV